MEHHLYNVEGVLVSEMKSMKCGGDYSIIAYPSRFGLRQLALHRNQCYQLG